MTNGALSRHGRTETAARQAKQEKGIQMCNRHDPLWTIQEVATFLGIPVQTIYDWRCKGEGPPALKIGRLLRYKETEVFAWLDQQTAA